MQSKLQLKPKRSTTGVGGTRIRIKRGDDNGIRRSTVRTNNFYKATTDVQNSDQKKHERNYDNFAVQNPYSDAMAI